MSEILSKAVEVCLTKTNKKHKVDHPGSLQRKLR